MTENQTAHKFTERVRTGDVLIDENVNFTGLLLSEKLLSGLHSAGFQRPSPIQLKAIPLGRCGLDLIVQAKSGTGKTCVFTVIALESIILESKGTQVLVLAPTREIAVQIWEVILSIGSCMKGLKCHTFIGGLPLHEDVQKLKKCHIAVGTPGRIMQLIDTGALTTESIRLFILDEADKLLEQNFQEQINWVYSSLPENKQMVALSATYPEVLAQHLTAYMRNPTFVRLNALDPALLGIKQFHEITPFHPLPNLAFQEKVKHLLKLLSSVSFHQCLIFSNYQTRAENLCESLNSKGWPSTFISGSQDQQLRLQAMAKLKNFECRVLISTDLTARGIDAERVNLVINLDVPKDHETYLHRIGRAGRFGTFGAAVTYASQGKEEQALWAVERKCHTHIKPLPEPIPSDLVKSEAPVNLDDLVSVEKINTSDSKVNNIAKPGVKPSMIADSMTQKLPSVNGVSHHTQSVDTGLGSANHRPEKGSDKSGGLKNGLEKQYETCTPQETNKHLISANAVHQAGPTFGISRVQGDSVGKAHGNTCVRNGTETPEHDDSICASKACPEKSKLASMNDALPTSSLKNPGSRSDRRSLPISSTVPSKNLKCRNENNNCSEVPLTTILPTSLSLKESGTREVVCQETSSREAPLSDTSFKDMRSRSLRERHQINSAPMSLRNLENGTNKKVAAQQIPLLDNSHDANARIGTKLTREEATSKPLSFLTTPSSELYSPISGYINPVPELTIAPLSIHKKEKTRFGSFKDTLQDYDHFLTGDEQVVKDLPTVGIVPGVDCDEDTVKMNEKDLPIGGAVVDVDDSENADKTDEEHLAGGTPVGDDSREDTQEVLEKMTVLLERLALTRMHIALRLDTSQNIIDFPPPHSGSKTHTVGKLHNAEIQETAHNEAEPRGDLDQNHDMLQTVRDIRNTLRCDEILGNQNINTLNKRIPCSGINQMSDISTFPDMNTYDQNVPPKIVSEENDGVLVDKYSQNGRAQNGKPTKGKGKVLNMKQKRNSDKKERSSPYGPWVKVDPSEPNQSELCENDNLLNSDESDTCRKQLVYESVVPQSRDNFNYESSSESDSSVCDGTSEGSYESEQDSTESDDVTSGNYDVIADVGDAKARFGDAIDNDECENDYADEEEEESEEEEEEFLEHPALNTYEDEEDDEYYYEEEEEHDEEESDEDEESDDEEEGSEEEGSDYDDEEGSVEEMEDNEDLYENSHYDRQFDDHKQDGTIIDYSLHDRLARDDYQLHSYNDLNESYTDYSMTGKHEQGNFSGIAHSEGDPHAGHQRSPYSMGWPDHPAFSGYHAAYSSTPGKTGSPLSQEGPHVGDQRSPYSMAWPGHPAFSGYHASNNTTQGKPGPPLYHPDSSGLAGQATSGTHPGWYTSYYPPPMGQLPWPPGYYPSNTGHTPYPSHHSQYAQYPHFMGDHTHSGFSPQKAPESDYTGERKPESLNYPPDDVNVNIGNPPYITQGINMSPYFPNVYNQAPYPYPILPLGMHTMPMPMGLGHPSTLGMQMGHPLQYHLDRQSALLHQARAQLDYLKNMTQFRY